MMNEIVADLDLFLSNPANIITLAYLCGGAFLSLVALGMTNTIIVYRDVADFIWSLAIVLTPILTLIALAMVAPEEATDTENLFWETGQQRLISSVGDFIKINGMLLYRSKPDEDGDIKLELVMGLRNVSEIHFDKVELKMTLNDRKGAEVDYSTDYGQLPPYSGRVMNTSIWGLSEARLKNCTVNISLDIYQPVAYATSTATLEKD